MCTSTLDVADALRAQPEIAIGELAALPGPKIPASGIWTSAALVPVQPPGFGLPPPVTVSAYVGVWLALPVLAVTVRVYVPAGADARVVTFRVAEPPAATDGGLTVAETPAGAPLTDRAT